MYGVMLWEILTFAREQPFENLTDEKVIENIGHIYQDSKKHVSYAASETFPPLQYKVNNNSEVAKYLRIIKF